jgi:hypothetical protein
VIFTMGRGAAGAGTGVGRPVRLGLELVLLAGRTNLGTACCLSVKLPATEGPRRDTRTGVNNLSDQQKCEEAPSCKGRHGTGGVIEEGRSSDGCDVM